MDSEAAYGRLRPLRESGANLWTAFRELLGQEFSLSTGHITAFLNGCLFAPSLLTFWFVNGMVDFSTALVLGSFASPAGLQVRLIAYLLLVPIFLLLRAGFHLVHPGHREQVLAGSCPQTRFLSLDWFSVCILATGLPLSLRHLGPWLGMNLILLGGLIVAPRFLPQRAASGSKITAIVVGSGVFVYAMYGATVPLLPDPVTVLGPVATLTLSPATTELLLKSMNCLFTGPIVVGVFAVAMNRILTHPEVRDIPIVRHTLPERDPDRIVVTSAAIGTVFYLFVVAAATGSLTVVP